MIFGAIIPFLIGAFGNYVVPLQIGARDMAFVAEAAVRPGTVEANDLAAVEKTFTERGSEIAAIIVEPLAANMQSVAASAARGRCWPQQWRRARWASGRCRRGSTRPPPGANRFRTCARAYRARRSCLARTVRPHAALPPPPEEPPPDDPPPEDPPPDEPPPIVVTVTPQQLNLVVGQTATLAAAVVLALPVKFAGTPSEVIETKDVRAIADIISAVVRMGRVR